MKLYKTLGILFFFGLLLSYPLYRTFHAQLSMPIFALLIPENADQSLTTQIWLDAAHEEGVPLEVVHYEDLLGPFQQQAFKSRLILVPDEVSQFAPGPLLSILENYVNQGGRLALVGNALTQDFAGRLLENLPVETYFHFPKILDRSGDNLQLHQSPVHLTDEWIKNLRLPPGVYTPSEYQNPKATSRTLCTYQSKANPYSHWNTEPAKNFSGQTIIEGDDGSLVAGVQKMGKGQAMWINAPLSYLVRRTDGMLLHSFLRYVSEDWAGLPKLLTSPDGIGGLVLNIHVDSNAALPQLAKLRKDHFFSLYGPFSIHVTAGPDARSAGDGLGFNVPNNKVAQDWIHEWFTEGHAVGSHGGWIHDYFGDHLTNEKTPEMENDLELNRYWIEKVKTKPVLEYSAPTGNHPVWVTHWLEDKGFNSYYFTGNVGLGPTQTYLYNEKVDRKIWAFPISAYQQVASFEEAENAKLKSEEMHSWLSDLQKYVSQNQVVRLFYFHPPGLQIYGPLLEQWVQENQKYFLAGNFRWYTMSSLAKFLTARAAEKWGIQGEFGTGQTRLKINSSAELSHFVWTLPKSGIKNVKVVAGHATLETKPDAIEVHPSADSKEAIVVQYEEIAL
jgi:hypothetical protein